METGDQVGGRYRLARPLEGTASREVWQARDEWSGLQVLLIRVPLPSGGHAVATTRRQVAAEVRAASSLHDPGLFPVSDVVADEGGLWVAGELGGPVRTLATVGSAGPIESGRLAAWGRELASGLTALHRAGLALRTITPGMVVIDPADRAALLGVAASPDPGAPAPDHDQAAPPLRSVPGLDQEARADVAALVAMLIELAPSDDSPDAAALRRTLQATSPRESARRLTDRLTTLARSQPTTSGDQAEPADGPGPTVTDHPAAGWAPATTARPAAPPAPPPATPAVPASAAASVTGAAAPTEVNAPHAVTEVVRPGSGRTAPQAAAASTSSVASRAAGAPPVDAVSQAETAMVRPPQELFPPGRLAAGPPPPPPSAPPVPSTQSTQSAPSAQRPPVPPPSPSRGHLPWGPPPPPPADATIVGPGPAYPATLLGWPAPVQQDVAQAPRSRNRVVLITAAAVVGLLVLGSLGWALIHLVSAVVPAPGQASATGPAQAPVSTTPAAPSAPPGAAAPGLLGDPRTADPCGLLSVEPMRRFGTPRMLDERGVVFGCRMIIEGPAHADAVLDAAFVPRSAGAPPGAERRGAVQLLAASRVGETCERRIVVPGGTEVVLNAGPFGSRPVQSCAIVEAALGPAVQVLSSGSVPRRKHPEQLIGLMAVDSCTVVDASVAGHLPGIDLSKAGSYFQGWGCHRGTDASGAQIDAEVLWGLPLVGVTTQFGTRAGKFVPQPPSVQSQQCTVYIQQRPLVLPGSEPLTEYLRLTVTSTAGTDYATACRYARDVATATAARMPPA